MRVIISILIGAAIAFGLFVIMAKLVANTNAPQADVADTPVIDIVMNDPDETTQTRQRVPPPPPPPPQQPPKIQPVEPDVEDANAEGVSFNMPAVDVGGASIDIGGVGNMQRDGDATPIVRIEPKYPVQAARDGKEGWVILSFTINEVGGVDDVEVIDADPKRIFDREAKRALKKWKYKPKIVDGKPEKQFNMKVQLDFKLDQG
ncbi:energy transducer TonB [Aliiglaciecola sp. LCG003]|uniref:energy transducer TonB n=1 Tax=Aliiglaciecola sp. LCG003 TaxID=3053655 RepID=UPI0025725777|nr:energy transducer TonB [Aliiglaciecola sp. LCG003]WJG08346.1 energy transducer TonB [Aliiglaciecola sp. LCG003]